MSALFAILWFIALLISIALIYKFVGMDSIVAIFPEGWRWWHIPAQLGSLALFAIVVLHHPFK